MTFRYRQKLSMSILSEKPRFLSAAECRQNYFLFRRARRVLHLFESEIPFLVAAFSECHAINRRLEIRGNPIRAKFD